MAVFFTHISDIHFGALSLLRADRLLEIIKAKKPQFCIVSGDITLRARTVEFLQAKQFLDSLELPLYIVPGNHDVPLHRFWERFLTPFARFEENIGPTQMMVDSDEYALVGINTASPWLAKEGRIVAADLESIENLAKEKSPNKLSIVVSHHPLPWIIKRLELLKIYPQITERLLQCPIDLYLCGHYHLSRHSFSKDWFSNRVGFESLFFQAGTALSSRLRGENNSFYFYKYEMNSLEVEHWLWIDQQKNFVLQPIMSFVRTNQGWNEKITDQKIASLALQ